MGCGGIMATYEFKETLTKDADGIQETRTYTFSTEDGALYEMLTPLTNFLQSIGYTYVESVDIRTADGKIYRGDLF